MSAVVIPLVPLDLRRSIARLAHATGSLERRLALSVVLRSCPPSCVLAAVEHVAALVDDDLAIALERLIVTRSAPVAAVEFSARLLVKGKRPIPESVVLGLAERCPAIDVGAIVDVLRLVRPGLRALVIQSWAGADDERLTAAASMLRHRRSER